MTLKEIEIATNQDDTSSEHNEDGLRAAFKLNK